MGGLNKPSVCIMCDLPCKGSAPFGFGIEQLLNCNYVSISCSFEKLLVFPHDKYADLQQRISGISTKN